MYQVQKVLSALCRRVETPRALAIHLLAQHGEWTQLQQLRMCEPCSYPSAEAYFKDNLVTELFRKCDLPGDTDRKKAVAVSTFWASEHQCCATNARLHRFLPNSSFIEAVDVPVDDFISRWRKDVKLLLGKLPNALSPRFSGGATYNDTGKLTTIPDKMSSTPTTYPNAHCLNQFFWSTQWGRAVLERRQTPDVVRGNIFFSVPKDSEKERGCGKEASIPVSLQLDAARYLRKSLLRIGIDLQSQAAYHSILAKQGSIDGSLATIDMSNASDTVATVLVKLILPEDWFLLLDSLRAKMTCVDKKWVRLEKFSSMGNGFTFELETLIFATLARRISIDLGLDPDEVSAFGDDLIVRSSAAKPCMSALRLFGFTLNKKKTFSEGPFRESCGGDFFNGVPVRAHYLKKLPDEPQQWIALANGLRRADPSGSYVLSAWRECLKNIPTNIRRCRGPASLEDLVINEDDPKNWTTRTLLRGEGYEPILQVRIYRPVSTVIGWAHWSPSVQLASSLLGIPSAGVTPRGGISGYKLSWCDHHDHASSWYPNGAVAP